MYPTTDRLTTLRLCRFAKAIRLGRRDYRQCGRDGTGARRQTQLVRTARGHRACSSLLRIIQYRRAEQRPITACASCRQTWQRPALSPCPPHRRPRRLSACPCHLPHRSGIQQGTVSVTVHNCPLLLVAYRVTQRIHAPRMAAESATIRCTNTVFMDS